MSNQLIIKPDPIVAKVIKEFEPLLKIKTEIEELLQHDLIDAIPRSQDLHVKLYNCLDSQMKMFKPKGVLSRKDLTHQIVHYQQKDAKFFHLHEELLRVQYREKKEEDKNARKLHEKELGKLFDSFHEEKESYLASLDNLMLQVPEFSFFMFLRNLHFELLIDPVLLNIALGFKRITFSQEIPTHIFWKMYADKNESDSLISFSSEFEQETENSSFYKFRMLPRFYKHAPELSSDYLIKFVGKHGARYLVPPPHLIELFNEDSCYSHLRDEHEYYSVKILPFLGECLRRGFTARDIFWNLSNDELFDPTNILFINPTNKCVLRLKEAVLIFLETYHERADDA